MVSAALKTQPDMGGASNKSGSKRPRRLKSKQSKITESVRSSIPELSGSVKGVASHLGSMTVCKESLRPGQVNFVAKAKGGRALPETSNQVETVSPEVKTSSVKISRKRKEAAKVSKPVADKKSDQSAPVADKPIMAQFVELMESQSITEARQYLRDYFQLDDPTKSELFLKTARDNMNSVIAEHVDLLLGNSLVKEYTTYGKVSNSGFRPLTERCNWSEEEWLEHNGPLVSIKHSYQYEKWVKAPNGELHFDGIGWMNDSVLIRPEGYVKWLEQNAPNNTEQRLAARRHRTEFGKDPRIIAGLCTKFSKPKTVTVIEKDRVVLGPDVSFSRTVKRNVLVPTDYRRAKIEYLLRENNSRRSRGGEDRTQQEREMFLNPYTVLSGSPYLHVDTASTKIAETPVVADGAWVEELWRQRELKCAAYARFKQYYHHQCGVQRTDVSVDTPVLAKTPEQEQVIKSPDDFVGPKISAAREYYAIHGHVPKTVARLWAEKEHQIKVLDRLASKEAWLKDPMNYHAYSLSRRHGEGETDVVCLESWLYQASKVRPVGADQLSREAERYDEWFHCKVSTVQDSLAKLEIKKPSESVVRARRQAEWEVNRKRKESLSKVEQVVDRFKQRQPKKKAVNMYDTIVPGKSSAATANKAGPPSSDSGVRLVVDNPNVLTAAREESIVKQIVDAADTSPGRYADVINELTSKVVDLAKFQDLAKGFVATESGLFLLPLPD